MTARYDCTFSVDAQILKLYDALHAVYTPRSPLIETPYWPLIHAPYNYVHAFIRPRFEF